MFSPVKSYSRRRSASADSVPADGSYYGTIYAGQVHAEDLFSSPNNTAGANAAFEEGLRMFTQALDVWLPAFKGSNGTATTSAGGASECASQSRAYIGLTTMCSPDERSHISHSSEEYGCSHVCTRVLSSCNLIIICISREEMCITSLSLSTCRYECKAPND
jgi:hypothetical protein